MAFDRMNLELGRGIPHARYESYLAERFPEVKELLEARKIPEIGFVG